MMWKELFIDLKARLLEYNEKIRSQKIRSGSRMVNASLILFILMITFLASNNSDGLKTFCLMIAPIFLIRLIHLFYAFTNKKKGLMIRYMIMIILEFSILYWLYHQAAFIFLIGIFVILIAFPLIFSINIKNS